MTEELPELPTITCDSATAAKPANSNRGALILDLGRCSLCLQMSALESMACAPCRVRYGKNGGLIADLIRRSPVFAGLFYRQLKPGQRIGFEAASKR